MATTTPNFGWDIPQSTDLVKDGATAIAALGTDIDTALVDLKGGTTGQVLSKASNTDLDFTWTADASGIPATIFDAKGDIIAATAADTASRLAVGANNTVLTADSSTATGLKWSSPSVAANWSLLNSGGTALTGAQTVTVSGISGADQIMILVDGASSASASMIYVRLNADTANNYSRYGMQLISATTYAPANVFEALQGLTGANGGFELGSTGTASGGISGYCLVSGCNSSGVKVITQVGAAQANSSSKQYHSIGGYYNSSSTISSVTLFSQTGNFDAGTVYVYTTA